MSNEMFTQLPTTGAAQLTDIICAVQGGVSGLSVQETLQQVANLMLSNTILHHSGNPNGVLAGQVYQFCWDTLGNGLYICTFTGTASTAVWTLIAQSSTGFIKSVKSRSFNAGISTYTQSTGMAYCIVEIVGGGGGGGGATGIAGQSSSGAGGSSGGYVRKLYTAANIGASAAVVCGGGGLGGLSGAGGSNGNASTFTPAGTGGALSAGAGLGGSVGSASAVNSWSGYTGGSSSSGGDINLSGTPSSLGVSYASGGGGIGGNGGNSYFGGGGFGGANTNGNASSASNYGAGGGGGGALTSNVGGGTGSNGFCIITEFCTQ